MTGRVEGKVAVVIGAARGIGAAIAERLVEEGARLAIGDTLEADGRATAARLSGQGETLFFAHRRQRPDFGRRRSCRRRWSASAGSTSWSRTPASIR